MPVFRIKVDIAQDNGAFLDDIVLEVQATEMDDARMLVMLALQQSFRFNSIDYPSLGLDVNPEDLPERGEGRGMEPTK